MVEDLRSADDYFGVCEVEIFRFQEILSCGVPDSPARGGVVVTGYTAHYTCGLGHTLRGKQQVTSRIKSFTTGLMVSKGTL